MTRDTSRLQRSAFCDKRTLFSIRKSLSTAFYHMMRWLRHLSPPSLFCVAFSFLLPSDGMSDTFNHKRKVLHVSVGLCHTSFFFGLLVSAYLCCAYFWRRHVFQKLTKGQRGSRTPSRSALTKIHERD